MGGMAGAIVNPCEKGNNPSPKGHPKDSPEKSGYDPKTGLWSL
jgi:hypothetical protein